MSALRWHAVSDAATLERTGARRILAAAERAIAERGEFRIVLSGGQTPRGVYGRLRNQGWGWKDWRVYFGDERCLPCDDPKRNSRMAGLAWLDHVAIPAAQVHRIPGELGAVRAAALYARQLEGVGEFDFVLLGLGRDGHTASLFPGRAWGDAPDAPDVLAVLDAPEPPPQRVTLSAARLSRAREVWFLVAGDSKREAVARWRAGEPLPAGAIQPGAGADVLVAP